MELRCRVLVKLLTFSVIAWASGRERAGAQEAAVYANRELGFSIAHPADWERKENISGAALALTAPPAKNAFRWNVSVIVHDLPKETTLQQFADAQSGGVEKMFSDYGKDEQKNVELGALKAVRIMFHFIQRETAVKCLSVLTVSNERGYVVTCSADAARFDDALKMFETIVASFKPL